MKIKYSHVYTCALTAYYLYLTQEFKIFIKIQNGNSTSVVQGIDLALIVTFNEAFCALWFSINHWRAMTAVSEH